MLGDLVDLVLPRSCLGCGANGRGVCARCLDVRPVVRYVPGLGAVHGAASYGGAIRSAIIHYKDRRRRDLRVVLAALLGSAVAAARAADGGDDPDRTHPVLVPIPSTTRAARERGGDHMRRLATSAGRAQRLHSDPMLRVQRAIEDAAGLGAQARRDNIAGAYVCRKSARAGPVILVDDVITTGASLLEAARTLRASGYSVVGVAVVAIVPLASRIDDPTGARSRARDGPSR